MISILLIVLNDGLRTSFLALFTYLFTHTSQLFNYDNKIICLLSFGVEFCTYIKRLADAEIE